MNKQDCINGLKLIKECMLLNNYSRRAEELQAAIDEIKITIDIDKLKEEIKELKEQYDCHTDYGTAFRCALSQVETIIAVMEGREYEKWMEIEKAEIREDRGMDRAEQ